MVTVAALDPWHNSAYLAWTGKSVPTILTIHNFAYQGLFSRGSLGRIGAPDASFHIDVSGLFRFGAKERFREMRRQAMGQSFSWSDASRDYAALYKAIA
jgi:glycogen synthase